MKPEEWTMIGIGGRMPAVQLKRMSGGAIEDVGTLALFAGKKVALFGVPGAFTKT